MPTFTNSTGLTFVDESTVSQTVVVSGFIAPVTQVVVTLTGLTHTSPTDLDLLLVGPDGIHNLLFWSDVGEGFDVTAATFVIADFGAALMPMTFPGLVNGATYKPTDYLLPGDVVENDSSFGTSTNSINHPADTGSLTLADAFNGINPNGTWTLYARDDAAVDTGSLVSWSLSILTAQDLVIDGTGGNDTLVVTATSQTSGTLFAQRRRPGRVLQHHLADFQRPRRRRHPDHQPS